MIILGRQIYKKNGIWYTRANQKMGSWIVAHKKFRTALSFFISYFYKFPW